MNTDVVRKAAPASRSNSSRVKSRSVADVVYRSGTTADALALEGLIRRHQQEGHLLPRNRAELETHAPRFVVATRRGRIVGCAELAPLSGRVAEVRSLVVDRSARGLGIGRALVVALQRSARVEGYETLCAFTHDAGYFVRMGFSIVPHTWVPEKIALDCHHCSQFRRCGQHAVVLPLGDTTRPPSDAYVPLATLRS
jgi:N-acetylglutamate synthase-like GNAT family acetyltransferase